MFTLIKDYVRGRGVKNARINIPAWWSFTEYVYATVTYMAGRDLAAFVKDERYFC